MQIERLENRQLFAVTVATTGGVLTVTGDEADNKVAIRAKGDDTLVVRTSVAEAADGTGSNNTSAILPHRRRGGRFRANLTKQEIDLSTTPITSINVSLGGGNDRANIGWSVETPATIDGGDGNDVISAGGGVTTINGGAGNDRLTGGSAATTINGGDGNDTIYGGAVADVLNGNADNDLFFTRFGGVDTIDGGTNTTNNAGSGDIAYVDGEPEAGSGTTTTTTSPTPTTNPADNTLEPDVVTNVEAVRTAVRRRWMFAGIHGGLALNAAGNV